VYTVNVLTQIRKAGNSYVIRVPREELERLGLAVNDHVLVELHPVDVRPRLTPELQVIADELLAQPETRATLARLADA
jgi:hypothetical protein